MAMTEREMLELAALAAGFSYTKPTEDYNGSLGLAVGSNPMRTGTWNPLTDDGQALRLAVKLGICLGPNFDNDRAVADSGEFGQHHVYELFGDDRYAATRRAIVRAAAEIGRGIAQQVTPDDLPEDNYYKTQAEAFGYTQEGK